MRRSPPTFSSPVKMRMASRGGFGAIKQASDKHIMHRPPTFPEERTCLAEAVNLPPRQGRREAGRAVGGKKPRLPARFWGRTPSKILLGGALQIPTEPSISK